MSRVVRLPALVIAVALTQSCRSHGDFPTSVHASDCVVAVLTVSPADATVHIGDTLRVSVSTQSCPGQVEPTLAPFSWSSSDSSVATVSASSGLVLAIQDGTVTITATSAEEPLVKGAMALRIAP